MSGICGQFNLDDAPVAEADLRAMSCILEKRGPEGTSRWHDGPVGLGYTLLATTPELQFERQPLTHPETGCVITADLRLDNRNELIAALGLRERRDPIGDAELILLTYLEWGEKCLDRLLGDFALAIWDPRHQKLFCARDHFGLRPLYYHHTPGKHFLFASDARAILVLPQVPYKINEGRVADFLLPELEWIDYTSTFFDDVYRLPPGHQVTVTPAGIDIAEYCKPQPRPELGPMSDEDYEQGFLEVFTAAVEARLRAPSGTVGSMLSGGMDSGSVVAVAKEILRTADDRPLHTYSAARGRHDDCAESRAIYAAISMPSVSPTLVLLDEMEDLPASLASSDEEPFDGEFAILKAIYRAARQHGQSVILDGAGGDVVLGHGSYITKLMRQGQLRLAMSEIIGESRFWEGLSIPSETLRYSTAAFVPDAVKKMLKPLRERHRVSAYLKESLVSRQFANGVRISERFETLRQTYSGSLSSSFETERSNSIRPNMTAGRERYARIAAANAIEARDPFLDKRVVDYCTRLPGRVLVKNGWPKMILRNVMADRLPDEVRWARGKPHLGYLFNVRATQHAYERGELSLSGLQSDLQGYADPAALADAWQEFRSGAAADRIHSARILAKWLRKSANRPVVSA
jgi:asparagine synthase (glutamine-hydrolysing)